MTAWPGDTHAATYRASLAAGSDRRTLGDLAAQGYVSVAFYCPHCRVIAHKRIEGLRRATQASTLKQFEKGIRCRRCGTPPAQGWVKPGRKALKAAP